VSFWYDKGVQKIMQGTIDLDDNSTTVIRVAFVSAAYTPAETTHEFYSDISANVVGGTAYNTNPSLTNRSVDATGAFDADDLSSNISSGTQVTRLVIYKEGAAAASSPLILLIDAASAGLPFTPNGNVQIAWDNGANKIARL
jgi:hypothetical protein